MANLKSLRPKLGQVLFAGASIVALIGCGASSNSAPIVYGTEPAQGRIYNSPAEIYLEQPARISPTSLQKGGPAILTQSAPYQTGPAVDPYSDQRSVRIYNRPPSVASASTITQAPLPPAPTSGPYAPYQSPSYSDEYRIVEVSNSPSQSVAAAKPTYRGLPSAPEYIAAPRTQSYIQPESNAPTGGDQYTSVAPGETVYAISRRTGYAPKDIIAVNNLYAPYNLAIGQTLRLPGSTPVVQSSGYNDPYAQPVTRPATYDRVVTQPAAQQVQPLYREVIARDILYAVEPGDTLYSVARKNNISVQSIVEANRMSSQALVVGQQLLLPAVPVNGAPIAQPAPTRQLASNAPVYVPTPAPRAQPPIVNNDAASKNIETLTRQASYAKPQSPALAAQFEWPVKGSVISNFGTGGIGRRNDGINIAAPLGTTIRAAADGEVVYRGAELDGYGNLLLVKHEGGFVTAYAHNDVMLVRKGQKVKKGQVIGKVGNSGAVSEPQLHFEIRQNLKSIDPMQFLASN